MAKSSKQCGELFSRIHALIKKEDQLVAGEKRVINETLSLIAERQHTLQQFSQETRRMARLVDGLANGTTSIDYWTADRHAVHLHPNANPLGSKQFVYSELIRLIKEDTEFLVLALSNRTLSGTLLDATAHAVVSGVFGNFFKPHEEWAVLAVVGGVLRRQLAGDDAPRTFFRSASMSLKLLQIYARTYTSTSQFLIAALREPIFTILAKDNLNLEVQPSKVWARLTPEEQAGILKEDDGTGGGYEATAGMARILAAQHAKLEALCRTFLDAICAHLVALPYGIRYLARELASAVAHLPEEDQLALMGDFFFLRIVNPAIVSPEPHGVVTDTPITPVARRNLTLVAKVLQGVSRGPAWDLTRERYMAPVAKRLSVVDLRPFYAAMVDVGEPRDWLAPPPDEDLHKGRLPTVALSNAELYALCATLAAVPATAVTPHAADIRAMVATVPSTAPPPDEEASPEIVFTIRVGQTVDALTLLPEEEVCKKKRHPSVTKEVTAAKAKLRRVLNLIDFGYPYKGRRILDILQREKQLAVAFSDRKKTASVEEAMRALNALPGPYRSPDFAPLLALMLDDYEKREKYRTYLSKVKLDLLLVLDQMEQHQRSVERLRRIYLDYKKQMVVRAYLTKREPQFQRFAWQFGSLPSLDSKSAAVQDFLDEVTQGLLDDPLWRRAGYNDEGPEERTRTLLMLNKCFMTRVYQSAFLARGDVDIQSDRRFERCARSLRALPLHHPSLHLPEHLLMEAPWTLAQKEIRKLNAFKDPGDKLEVIVNTCKLLMELLSLSVANPGADEFFPVFVYVVAQSGVQYLPSNVQYIEHFYRRGAMPAEYSYWFVQFCSCVAYIANGVDGVSMSAGSEKDDDRDEADEREAQERAAFARGELTGILPVGGEEEGEEAVESVEGGAVNHADGATGGSGSADTSDSSSFEVAPTESPV